jgi:hypothetical protein
VMAPSDRHAPRAPSPLFFRMAQPSRRRCRDAGPCGFTLPPRWMTGKKPLPDAGGL